MHSKSNSSGVEHLNEADRKRCFPPCRAACPAQINIQAYISLISQGRFKEALEVIRRYIPFPAVCGRVCFAPCEDACQRGNVDDPPRIRLLKRLVADEEFSLEREARAERVPPKHEEAVVVFESHSKPGGMLRYCIPRHRLPEELLDAEIDHIMDSGMEIRTNTTIGKYLLFEEIWEKGYSGGYVLIPCWC